MRDKLAQRKNGSAPFSPLSRAPLSSSSGTLRGSPFPKTACLGPRFFPNEQAVVAALPPVNPPVAAGQQQPQQEAELPQGVEHPQGVLMRDLPLMPGTPGALSLHIVQFLFACMALAIMTSTDDFLSVTAFCALVAAVILQGLWSLMLTIVNIYALMVKRCLRNRQAVRLFAVGDVITGGITLCGAGAAAAIIISIDNDLHICAGDDCVRFQSAVALTFICLFSIAPTCLLNLWSLATVR